MTRSRPNAETVNKTVEPLEPVVPPVKRKRRTKLQIEADKQRQVEAQVAADAAEKEATAKCTARANDAARLESEQSCDIVDATPRPNFRSKASSACTSHLGAVQSVADDAGGMDVDGVDAEDPENPEEIPQYTDDDVDNSPVKKKGRVGGTGQSGSGAPKGGNRVAAKVVPTGKQVVLSASTKDGGAAGGGRL